MKVTKPPSQKIKRKTLMLGIVSQDKKPAPKYTIKTFTQKDRIEVELLVAFGHPLTDIATHLNIDIRTLNAHFSKEILAGKVNQQFKFEQNMFKLAHKARDEGVRFRATAFALSRKFGWKEQPAESNVDVPVEGINVTGGLPSRPANGFNARDTSKPSHTTH